MLRRSESELRNALQLSHHLIDEPNARGLRPLHLSVGWPCGVKVLLSDGANINVADENGLYPVEHAIQLGCPESLALFGEADCALRPSSRESTGTLAMAIILAANPHNKQAVRVSIAEYVITMEANQRRKLQELVFQYLPESSICVNSPFDEKLLDVYAVDAVTALRQHGVSIPHSLELNEYLQTVYHFVGGTSKISNFLWEAGFRDINEPDSYGRTPLILYGVYVSFHHYLKDFLERTEWFLDKGVDPNQKIQHIHQNSYWNCNSKVGCSCLKSSHSAVHFLAFNLSILKYWAYESEDQPRYSTYTRFLPVLKDIFNNETGDACQCACSSAGCRAINIICKWSHNDSRVPINDEELFQNYLHWLIWPIPTTMVNDVLPETTISEIVRALTFQALDLTHTCCRSSDDWVTGLQLVPFEDKDDISEIHDEEREDLQLFEDLLLEFDQHRRDSRSSIWDFMKGYWRTRMLQVLSGKQSLDISSKDEPQNMPSEEESLEDEDEPRRTGVDFDNSSLRHRVAEVFDDPKDDSEDSH